MKESNNFKLSFTLLAFSKKKKNIHPNGLKYKNIVINNVSIIYFFWSVCVYN